MRQTAAERAEGSGDAVYTAYTLCYSGGSSARWAAALLAAAVADSSPAAVAVGGSPRTPAAAQQKERETMAKTYTLARTWASTILFGGFVAACVATGIDGDVWPAIVASGYATAAACLVENWRVTR